MTSNHNKATTIQAEPVESRRLFLRRAGLLCMAAPSVASSLMMGEVSAKSTDHASMASVEAASEVAKPGALSTLSEMATRRLHLVNSHTGDDEHLVYFINGIYIENSLVAFNHLMRDRRANKATKMDPSLYDQLFLLRSTLKTDAPVHVLSGYRTPETNAKLRSRSSGVAKYSLHMEGRAADIYVPGHTTKRVQQTALSLKAGGVGVYSKSGFVHVDTGQVRHWGK